MDPQEALAWSLQPRWKSSVLTRIKITLSLHRLVQIEKYRTTLGRARRANYGAHFSLGGGHYEMGSLPAVIATCAGMRGVGWRVSYNRGVYPAEEKENIWHSICA